MRNHILLTFALLVAPAALLVPDARSDAQYGTPKYFCEDIFDSGLHEYSAPGFWERDEIFVDDQNVIVGYTHTAIVRGDGALATPSSCFPGDGHFEFGIGGALLAGEGGSADGGSVNCLGEIPHHSWFNWPTVYVDDSFLGNAIDFTVLSDWPQPGQEALFPCGDGILEPCPNGGSTSGCNPNDEWIYGFGGSVQVPFGVGANGAHYVFVEGTTGHVWTYI